MVDLLRHTSGLTYSFQERTPVDAAYRKTKIDDFDADYTMDGFIEGLAKIPLQFDPRSEEHTSELQSLMRISYAVFCLKKKTTNITTRSHIHNLTHKYQHTQN